MKMHLIFACLLLGGVLAGCTSPRAQTSGPASLQLRKLGHHSFAVSTTSPKAQEAFDRGLTLAYSFGHFAAEQEFRRAAELDPNCAMAWWGVALVNGPHINFPFVPPPRAAAAWEALGKAQALAPRASALEQELIRALAQRYAEPQPEDRQPLDNAYAAAMREVWRANPQNADVGALCAEALLDLHPWNLWQGDQPQPWTPEILAILERVLELNPQHPGANHFYIHAIEASPHPEKAEAAADRLRSLVPDSSHMVHMPSHIYARMGRWRDASAANQAALKADQRYRAAYPRPGFYAMYMAHNAHFLAFSSMMRAQSAKTIGYARQMVREVPEDFLRDYAQIADGYTIFVSEAMMRFGKWEEILAEPAPRPGLPLAKALWHFTRTSALVSLNRLDEARTEQAAFAKAREAVPAGWTFGNNSASNILAIAACVIEGEMAARIGDLPGAAAGLAEGVRIEDSLLYDEPPDWIQPVRHTLGAVLLRAGRAEEAEAVYREDLKRYPENGWSLLGLRDALRAQKKTAEAMLVDNRFKRAWRDADVQPTVTCYCQAGL